MIIRRKLDSDYTVIPNAIIENKLLSPEARWTLIYLLSKPRDWVVRVSDIRNAGGYGRDKAYTLVNDLVEAGYIEKVQQRQGDGVFGEIEYVVSDKPHTEIQEPLPDLPDTANTELSKYGAILSTDSLLAKASKTQSVRDDKVLLWDKVKALSAEFEIPEQKLRPIIGRWLKKVGDDPAALCIILDEAADQKPIDYVGFVSGIIASKQKKEDKSKAWLEMWND